LPIWKDDFNDNFLDPHVWLKGEVGAVIEERNQRLEIYLSAGVSAGAGVMICNLSFDSTHGIEYGIDVLEDTYAEGTAIGLVDYRYRGYYFDLFPNKTAAIVFFDGNEFKAVRTNIPVDESFGKMKIAYRKEEEWIADFIFNGESIYSERMRLSMPRPMKPYVNAALSVDGGNIAVFDNAEIRYGIDRPYWLIPVGMVAVGALATVVYTRV